MATSKSSTQVKIGNLADVRKAFAGYSVSIFGIGVVFNGQGFEQLGSNFGLIQLDMNDHLSSLAEKMPIFSLEQEIGAGGIAKIRRNTLALLKHPRTKQYINNLEKPFVLFPAKSSKKVAALCRKNKWPYIMSRVSVQERFENKIKFYRMISKTTLEKYLPATIITKLKSTGYEQWKAKLNSHKVVVQLPKLGGGVGTFIVDEHTDIARLMKKHKGKSVRVSAFVPGHQISVGGCVVRQGVLVSQLREQIVGEEIATSLHNAWVGNSWLPGRFPAVVQHEAQDIARKVGAMLHKDGYRGIFGIDLIWQSDTDQLTLIEVNPRLLGSTPFDTVSALERGHIPFLALHLLELLKIPYTIDMKKAQRQAAEQVEGSFILLHNTTDKNIHVNPGMKSGVYRWDQGLKYVRDGISLEDLKTRHEVLISDLPRTDHIIPERRIGRVTMNRAIVGKNGKIMTAEAEKLAKIAKLISAR